MGSFRRERRRLLSSVFVSLLGRGSVSSGSNVLAVGGSAIVAVVVVFDRVLSIPRLPKIAVGRFAGGGDRERRETVPRSSALSSFPVTLLLVHLRANRDQYRDQHDQ